MLGLLGVALNFIYLQGKSKNMWTCMGYLIACADTSVMAIHDCDILTYEREMLARLVYPVANPSFPYQMSKGYYPRIGGDKLNGRLPRPPGAMRG
mgnify:CR=1 FL=1